ncbi:MAG: hypothetical protein L0170_13830, partial [Acidobacteria bacterium]|nr:hypothetical protein [Acidobacteriota bacterium]
MILGMLWLLLANAAVLLGAALILRRTSTGQKEVDLAQLLIIRFVLISAVSILAGLTGMLSGACLGIAGAICLAIILARGGYRHIQVLPSFAGIKGLWWIAAVVAIRLLLQVWFFSPHNCDAISYHLTKVAEWVRAGSFTKEMGIDTHVTFPAGFELIELWWVVFLRHDVLIEMAGVEFLLLSFVAVRGLAVHLGMTAGQGVLAGLLYVLTPSLHLQATACLNDGAVAALFLATALFIVTGAPATLVLTCIALGIGVKPIYAYSLPGLALLWMLAGRRFTLGPWNRTATALAFLALFSGGFWYARN